VIERVVVADDDLRSREFFRDCLSMRGIEVFTAADAEEAYRAYRERNPDLVVTDLRMPGGGGLELLRRIRSADVETAVVVVTAYGSVETAVAAVKEGAEDFLLKPLGPEQVEHVLERVAERRRLRAENRLLRAESAPEGNEIVGRSPAILSLLETARRVARSRATVLVLGESGTGKERFARLLHAESPRREGPFIRVNCAALAESVLESELFGHEKGAFTGAVRKREGRFELADGGTLLLDEIGEMRSSLQAKLLRVLEEREFERVGGTKTLRVDVRVVATTNRDLEHESREGRFREDLFWRLQVVTLRIPPLRERSEDVEPLALHFLERYRRENGSRVGAISPEALDVLRRHAWPGNVRELENTIERAVVLDAEETIRPEHLVLSPAKEGPADLAVPVGRTIDDLERALVLRTLEETGYRRRETARILGITPRTLTNKISRYRKEGIEVRPPLRRRPAPLEGRSTP
jgi:DNA-binding NtrC family response regulator